MEPVNPATQNSRGSGLAIWVALYFLIAGYFYYFAEYGLNIWDEGGYANGTLRTLNGQRALVDFNPNGYLPGRYIYSMFFFKWLGVSINSLRLGMVLLSPLMVFMVYGTSRRIMPPGFAFLAALCMLCAPSMYYNRFYPFFCVLNLYALTLALEKIHPPRLLLLAGAILLSGFFKFEIALFSLLISVVCLVVAKSKAPADGEEKHPAPKPYGPVLGGLSLLLFLGFIGMVIYFIKLGFLSTVFMIVIDAHHVWGNPFPDFFPFFKLLEQNGLHQMVQRLLFYLPVWVYGIVAIALALQYFDSDKTRFSPQLLAVLLFGVCAFGLVLWRAGFDNLLRTLPPFYILFCYLLFRIRGKVERSFLFACGEQPVGTLRSTALNVFSVALPFLFCYEMNVHHGFYAGSIGAMKQETELVEMERMKIYTNPVEAQWIRALVDRIELYSHKGDPILALPLNPIFYFLTDRVNPIPYDWILPGMLTPKDEEDIIKMLNTNKPKLIIFVDIPIDGKEERRLSRYAPDLTNYIASNYVFEEIIGFFQILLPKEAVAP